MRRAVLALAVLLAGASPAGALSPEFPNPPGLQPAVRFWTRIYTEVATDGALIHDANDLDVVYERMDFGDDLGGRELDARTEGTREKYRQILRRLASGPRENLSADEQRVLGLFPANVSDATLRLAAESVRLQRGQANRFREGIIRSGAWEGYIERTLARKGLPAEISTLPHVESSYNPEAYSKVGAAGLWQFMPSTGRLYMRVDSVVDERMDPFKATEAAAELLRHNHDMLGTWPLALTAYNHGAGGLARAVRALGTNDIAEIVRRYDGPGFGFASRNFYTSFLAAYEASHQAEKYFGPIRKQTPIDYRVVRLEKSYSVKTLANALGADLDTIRAHNLSLREAFWRGKRAAPAGITLRVPKPGVPLPDDALAIARAERWRPPSAGSTQTATVDARPAAEPAAEAIAASDPAPAPAVLEPAPIERTGTLIHVLRAGESVYSLARRYGVDSDLILHANHVKSPRDLRAGTRLRIPAPAAARIAESEPVHAVEPTPAAEPPSAPAQEVAQEPVDAAPLAHAPGSDALPPPEPEPESLGAVVASLARDEALEPAAPETSGTGDEPPIASAADEDEAPLGSPIAAAPKKPSRAPAPAPAARQRAAAEPPAATGVPIDRSRYRVGTNNTIAIQPDETLAKIAGWLGVEVQRLRKLNKLPSNREPRAGQKLRLDFAKVSKARFEAKRLAHHEAVREEFFERFEVAGTQQRVIKKGDTLYKLTQGGKVPAWLLRHYNPKLDLDALRPGVRVTIPKLEKRTS
jgi:membrane-bound lytic murein transglycosylase D